MYSVCPMDKNLFKVSKTTLEQLSTNIVLMLFY